MFGSVAYFEDAEAGVTCMGGTICWTGGGGTTSWNNVNNWVTSSGEAALPTSIDVIVISGAVTVNLDIDFTLTSGGGLDIINGATLFVDPDFTLTWQGQSNSITINCNSRLIVLGTLDNSGIINLPCGTSELTNNGAGLINNKDGLIAITGTYSNNALTTNDGRIVVQGGGLTLNNNDVIDNNNLIIVNPGQVFNNRIGAEINNAEGATIRVLGELNNDGVINNEGDIDTNGDLNNKLLGEINVIIYN